MLVLIKNLIFSKYILLTIKFSTRKTIVMQSSAIFPIYHGKIYNQADVM